MRDRSDIATLQVQSTSLRQRLLSLLALGRMGLLAGSHTGIVEPRPLNKAREEERRERQAQGRFLNPGADRG